MGGRSSPEYASKLNTANKPALFTPFLLIFPYLLSAVSLPEGFEVGHKQHVMLDDFNVLTYGLISDL